MKTDEKSLNRYGVWIISIAAIFASIYLVFIGVGGVNLLGKSNNNPASTTQIIRQSSYALTIKDPIDFELTNLNGEKLKLSTFKGTPVVLNFWGSWCPPCIEELPSLIKFASFAKKKGIKVIAVSSGDTVESIRATFKKLKIENTIKDVLFLLDMGEDLSKKYGTYKFPETYFINTEYLIKKKWIGSQDWTSVEVLSWFDENVK